MSPDGLQHPSHLRPGPDSASLGSRRRSPSPRGRGIARPDAAAAPRPLARLRHRRPGRARLRQRGGASSGDRGSPHRRPPAGALLLEQGAISADQLSRAVAERYGLDHVDLSVYQVDMAAADLFPVDMARRYKAVPVGFVDQRDAAGRDRRPGQRARRRRHPDRDRARLPRSRSPPRRTSRRCWSRLSTLQSAATEAIIEDAGARRPRTAEAGSQRSARCRSAPRTRR